MKRTKALLFLTLALCAALLTAAAAMSRTRQTAAWTARSHPPSPDGSLGNHDGAVRRNRRQPCRVRKRHDGGF